jgi:hypothetical protein
VERCYGEDERLRPRTVSRPSQAESRPERASSGTKSRFLTVQTMPGREENGAVPSRPGPNMGDPAGGLSGQAQPAARQKG